MRLTIAVSVACLLAATLALAAQRYPEGPESQVNVIQQSFQGSASVASDAAGNFVVAWVGPYIDGDYFGLGARRFDKLGNPLGGDFQVNTYTTGSQSFPQVAMTPTGEFVVVWTDYNRDGSSHGLLGQAFDSAGSPAGGEFAVNVFTTSRQSRHSVAMGASGDFVVVWDSYTQGGDLDGIYGRLFFGPVTRSLGETDGDGVCENLDNCPGLYNPGQDDTDGDSVGDLCDVTLTSHQDMDVLDCSDPAAIQPTFTWSAAAFDRSKVSMGSSPGFEKGTVVSSGDRFIQTGSYTPPRKKQTSACKKALAANPSSTVMFIKVFGKDRDLPKANPGATTFSETVQVGITG